MRPLDRVKCLQEFSKVVFLGVAMGSVLTEEESSHA
jgi:hypothetical protein